MRSIKNKNNNNNNHEFVEFVKNNSRFFDPEFVENVEKGRYKEVEINSDEDHFRVNLEKSTVTVNRAEEHDIANFNFNNLRLQLQEQEVFEGVLPVIRVTQVTQRKVPQAVSAAPKKSSNAEKWQKEVNLFLSEIMPDRQYKGCVSSFILAVKEDGITKIKRYEYDDLKKEFSVATKGDSTSPHSKITSNPQGDLKTLQAILDPARKGLQEVEVLRVKFSKPLETQRPNPSVARAHSDVLRGGPRVPQVPAR